MKVLYLETYKHLRYLVEFFLEWKIFHIKFAEENKTRFIFKIFFPKIVTFVII